MWGEDFIDKFNPSIEYLELFALVAGVLTWESEEVLVNTRITIFCDNMGIVGMINKMTSNCKILLRILTLNNLRFNRRITARYVDTKSNFLADALSRNQIKRFKMLGPEMNDSPDKITESMWPISKVWEKYNSV